MLRQISRASRTFQKKGRWTKGFFGILQGTTEGLERVEVALAVLEDETNIREAADCQPSVSISSSTVFSSTLGVKQMTMKSSVCLRISIPLNTVLENCPREIGELSEDSWSRPGSKSCYSAHVKVSFPVHDHVSLHPWGKRDMEECVGDVKPHDLSIWPESMEVVNELVGRGVMAGEFVWVDQQIDQYNALFHWCVRQGVVLDEAELLQPSAGDNLVNNSARPRATWTFGSFAKLLS